MINSTNLMDKNSLDSKESHESLLNFFKEDSEFLPLLKPLLNALGWPGHHRHLIESLPHFYDVLDLTNFRNVLAKLNYKSYLVQTNLLEIKPGILPCLFVPSNNQACFIILGKNEEYFTIQSSDSYEKTQIPVTDLEGDVYVFKAVDPDENILKKENWFFDILSRYKSLLYQVCGLSIILNLFLLATPIFIMAAYDKVIPTGSHNMIFHFMAGAIIFLIGGLILQSLRAKIIAFISARLDVTIGDSIFEHLLYLSPRYTESAAVGAQVSRIKDFDNVREFITSPYVATIFELPFTIFALVVIGTLSIWLMYVPIIMILAFIVLFCIVHPTINKLTKQNSKENAKREIFEIESLTNLKEIKSLAGEDIWINRFREISSKATFSGFRLSLTTFVLNTISDSIVLISGLAVIYIGVQEVINQELTPGALIAIMMLVWRTLSPIKLFFSMLPKLTQISSSIKQINLLMRIKVERDPNKIIAPINTSLAKINFQRVSFRYRNDLPPALLGVSLTINPGELVCIVGRNGSGKSSLCKLLTQMYIPQGGSIFLENINIKQLDPIELRNSIAYLPQSSKLFFGTIEQNLKFANIVATEKEMIEACRRANILDEIYKMPLGFQTHIDDCSSDLYSATFKQKIALARAYLKNSSVIIFDEPTSHLDNQDDDKFLEELKKMKGDKTLLLITHRPAQMRIADKIVFLDHGNVILQGHPDEVLSKIPFSLL